MLIDGHLLFRDVSTNELTVAISAAVGRGFAQQTSLKPKTQLPRLLSLRAHKANSLLQAAVMVRARALLKDQQC